MPTESVICSITSTLSSSTITKHIDNTENQNKTNNDDNNNNNSSSSDERDSIERKSRANTVGRTGGDANGGTEENDETGSAAALSPAEEGIHTMNPLNLRLRMTTDRGLGVFTDQTIPSGILLEESPVLILSKGEWDDGELEGTVLGSYGFSWSNGAMAIGLGLGEFRFESLVDYWLMTWCSLVVQPLQHPQCQLHPFPINIHYHLPNFSPCSSGRRALHLLFSRREQALVHPDRLEAHERGYKREWGS